jgi:hypothetical protein
MDRLRPVLRKTIPMSLRDAYRQKFEAQLEEATARLAILKARAKRAAAEGRIFAHDELGITEEKIAQLKSKLKESGGASEGAWEELKVGIEGAWAELSTAARKAADKFNSEPAPGEPKKATQVEPS